MKNHPKIEVPATKMEKILHLLSLLLIIGSFIYVSVSFSSLPDEVPVHFNINGEPDSWGNKATILIMPIISVFIFLPMYFLSKAPHTFNYMVKVTEENAPRIYPIARLMMAVINFFAMVLFAYIAWDMVQAAHGINYSGIWLFIITLGLPLLIIIFFGLWMNKVK
ncbi:DUF1648 domain-containing protein [Ornithinibacillus sp. 4-3]|uniref:DUF1648 domain-containing protein n=1 Tax=Ornithinibacillus sp. 4-3 TaxID=3231488 RepID=A0AB39HU33_9BACI